MYHITANIEESTKELSELIELFDTREVNDSNLCSRADLNKDFKKTIYNSNKSLAGNKRFLFCFKEMPVADIWNALLKNRKYFLILFITHCIFLIQFILNQV